MSRYLVDRIRGLPNVEVVTGATVSGLEGRDGVLECGALAVGAHRRRSTARRSIICFCSSAPNPIPTGSSGSGIALDAKGFVLTGADAGDGRHVLETTRNGVFAIGDVRAKSVKRVAAAVGEGAQVVAALHTYLASAEPNLGGYSVRDRAAE